jgi:nicotinamidase/pyrazinamidase
MMPGGKLYVPGAEKLIPNINRLVEPARQGRVLLISSADAHAPDDSEFHQWPPHCVKGTSGAAVIPDARAGRQLVIPNQIDFMFPPDFSAYHEVLLEKNTLDVFDNPNTDRLLTLLSSSRGSDEESGLHALLFGVVTEYCVLRAADGLLRRGNRVSIVQDAIQSLDDNKEREVLDGLQRRGAVLLSTDQALSLLNRNVAGITESRLRTTADN